MGSTSHGCANSECGRVKQHVNQLCHDGQLAIIRTGDDDGIELGIDRRRLTWSRSTGRTWAYECNSTRCSGSGTPAWCWPPPNGSTLSLATGATSHPHPGGLPAQQPFGGRLCRTHRTQGRGDSVRGALAGRQPETRRRGPARRRRDHQPPHRQQVPGSENRPCGLRSQPNRSCAHLRDLCLRPGTDPPRLPRRRRTRQPSGLQQYGAVAVWRLLRRCERHLSSPRAGG